MLIVSYFLRCACELLGITQLDSELQLPPGIKKGSAAQQC